MSGNDDKFGDCLFSQVLLTLGLGALYDPSILLE